MQAYKGIPYGVSSLKSIRQQNYYYVDKSRYIPILEQTGNFLFLIRPRRFGKSSLLTVLESYYDIARPEEFDYLFADSYLQAHPTPEKNSYLILKFNFSQVDPHPERVEESFQGHVRNCFFFFGKKYRQYLEDDYFAEIEQHKQAHQKLEFLINYVGFTDHKLYILIDEYDNFANTILTTAGQASYHELTHGSGFFRFFFNVLKGSVDQVDAGLNRLFITGVSPVTMDDVTSGFNIGQNISLMATFNELLGFTEQDVRDMIEYYRSHGVVMPGTEALLSLMRDWYDNYCFSRTAQSKLFNTDMVLYFIKHFLQTSAPPEEMIDQNIRVDYGKLRHLVVLDQGLNRNFSQLSEIIETGQVAANIVTSFPVERLTKPENFVSLLYYFGLLSFTNSNELHIPNRTVRNLMYSYLREGYEDVNIFSVDLWYFATLIRNMAYHRAWPAVFQFLAQEIEQQTSIRDYLTGEKVVQTFLLAYLNVTDYYITRTEEEMGKGFVDLYLEPFWSKYGDIQYGYLIEIKYIAQGDFSQAMVDKKLDQAKKQLKRYATDERVVKGANLNKSGQLICLILIFSGWQLVKAEELQIKQQKIE